MCQLVFESASHAHSMKLAVGLLDELVKGCLGIDKNIHSSIPNLVAYW